MLCFSRSVSSLPIQILAHLRRVLQQMLVHDRAHGGDARRAGDRVAAKGGAVVARLEDVHARLASIAPIGTPPASPFAIVVMSGRDAHVSPS